jgi:hypothetical protein
LAEATDELRMADMMRVTIHTPVLVVLLLVMVAAACSTSPASMAPSQVAAPSPVGGATTIPDAATTKTPTEAPAPTARPMASPVATVTAGTTAATVVDGLRVRSQPRIADDSVKFEPVLPLGSQVYVLDGPILASGYAWYEVASLGSRTLPQGWVAAASRTAEPWLAPDQFACPPVPTDFTSLAALPPAVGLACFPRTPITLVARLISCECDVDGGWLTPRWFSLGTGSPEMLIGPQMTRTPSDVQDWFWLNLDPAGQRPETLPVGKVVEVTGVFDHPGAAGCTFTELDRAPVPSQRCRLAFAVGRLVVKP